MALLVCMWLSVPRNAWAQTVPVDVNQVLGALAEVVKDRATQVASQTLRKKVVASLCGSDPKQGKALQLKVDGADRTLTLGGSSDCQGDPTRKKCTASDVFVATCRDALDSELTLTDAHFLSDVGHDAVGFVLRLAAMRLTDAQYDDMRMGDLAQFLYDAMAAMAHPNPQIDDLATPLETLADSISPDVARKLLRIVAEAPQTASLASSLRQQIENGCKSAPADPICSEYAKDSSYLLAPAAFGGSGGKQYADACTEFFSRTQQANRKTAFGNVFKDANAQYKNRPCSGHGDVHACHRAHALLGLGQALEKAVCSAYSDDLDRDFRNIVYVFLSGLETDASKESITQVALLAGNPSAGAQMTSDFASLQAALSPVAPAMQLAGLAHHGLAAGAATKLADAVHGLPASQTGLLMDPSEAAKPATSPATVTRVLLSDLPRQELAVALRVLALGLRAYEDDPTGCRAWLASLERDASSGNLQGINDGIALDTDTRSNLSAPVAALRDAVKDLLVLPRFQIIVATAPTDPAAIAVEHAVLNLLHETSRIGATKETFQTSLNRLIVVFSDLSALDRALQSWSGLDDNSLRAMTDALSEAGQALQCASAHDWVGLAIEASERLEKLEADSDIEPSMRFVRMLMSAYQASSPDEAKAVMKSALEDESSREKRWDVLAIDVSALVGARGGYQWNQGGTLVDSEIVGLYAPFGVQVAYDAFGLLAYPLDLGSYLIANVKNTQAPSASAAIRFGGALYWRMSSDVPLDLGVGGDYRPAFENGAADTRVALFLTLELPLYTLR